MSCGCGGLPPSVLIRLEAAKLVPNGDVAKATELADFIRGTKSDAELDTPPKRASGVTHGATERNAFLMRPTSDLHCDQAVLGKLAQARIDTIGQLIQWHSHQLREHAGLAPTEIQGVAAELMPHGLRLGLDTDQIRNWILHGSLVDPAIAAQAAKA